jgi:hypothetical protein
MSKRYLYPPLTINTEGRKVTRFYFVKKSNLINPYSKNEKKNGDETKIQQLNESSTPLFATLNKLK